LHWLQALSTTQNIDQNHFISTSYSNSNAGAFDLPQRHYCLSPLQNIFATLTGKNFLCKDKQKLHMRKIVIPVLLLLACQLVNAQGRIGIKAGTSYYTMHASNDKTKDYAEGKFGYLLGVTYELVLNKSFLIQPELNYSYQVARENYFGSNLKLNYTQVPILLHFHPGTSPVTLYAGPQLSFLGTAKIRTDAGKTTGFSGSMNQTDFGIAFGGGYVPAGGKSGLSVDIRVYKGMMNAAKAEYDGGLRTRNNLVMLTVGYLFNRK
jgi:Outer membrane protein beta-barrel domain